MSAHIGAGYGSEFHLMRYMARYRNKMNDIINNEIMGQIVEWLDFIPGCEYNPENPAKVILPDNEWEGLDFLKETDNENVLEKWNDYWPQNGKSQNWDAIAKAKIDNRKTWIIVEAKAHTDETKSECNAISLESIQMIDKAFKETKQAFGITSENDWKKTYYQYANRMATLHFLLENDIPAKLLFIYFFGDKHQHLTKGSICPNNEKGWHSSIEEQRIYLGLSKEIMKKKGIHEIFLNVVKPK